VPASHLALDGPPGVGERQADAAAVGGSGLALYNAPFGEPVYQAGQGGLAEQDM